MIQLRNLENRTYEGKKCIAFEFPLYAKDGPFEFEMLRLRFTCSKLNRRSWEVTGVIKRTKEDKPELYYYNLEVPSEDFQLPMVAAAGLGKLRKILEEEVAIKSNIQITIGEIIAGM